MFVAVMCETIEFKSLTEPDLRLLAEAMALKVRGGDVIALEGDLGAGKTTFARAFIRAMLGDPAAEVPSPTFSVLQLYDTPRGLVRHFDLYRLASPDELIEIGFDDDRETAITLMEWPAHAGPYLPEQTTTVALAETPGCADRRDVVLHPCAAMASRLSRISPILDLIHATHTGNAAHDLRLSYLQGDASARAYSRLDTRVGRRIVMDAPAQPDGPPIRDGQPYSRIAHLAERIDAFLAIGATLARHGFSAPDCYGFDAAAGVAILEDLGGQVFGTEATAHLTQETLWREAVTTLVALHAVEWPDIATGPGELTHALPRYDMDAMAIELGLLVNWYLPWAAPSAVEDDAHCNRLNSELLEAYAPHLETLTELPTTWVLRDFHSPNLIWLPDRPRPRRIGLLDFQDAQIGPFAYDLVSLLQDARCDVPPDLETTLRNAYVTAQMTHQSGFDADAFDWSYAVLGAQRNTKILGIFARLAARDGKPQYLRHIPRIRGYLDRNLAHPGLTSLKQWYDAHLPPAPG